MTISQQKKDDEFSKGPAAAALLRRGSPLSLNPKSLLKRKQLPIASKKSKTGSSNKQQKKKGKVKQTNNATRALGFGEEEDLILCKAFVNVSENPVIGNNQKGSTFWAAVGSRFRELYSQLDEYVLGQPRNNDSLKLRFQRQIQPCTQVFNKYYKQIKDETTVVGKSKTTSMLQTKPTLKKREKISSSCIVLRPSIKCPSSPPWYKI